MVNNADKMGSQVTVGNDKRITKVGNLIRKFRLDEICQLIDVFRGTMTFVGTRPEVPKYVEKYTPEMKDTSPKDEIQSCSYQGFQPDKRIQDNDNDRACCCRF